MQGDSNMKSLQAVVAEYQEKRKSVQAVKDDRSEKLIRRIMAARQLVHIDRMLETMQKALPKDVA